MSDKESKAEHVTMKGMYHILECAYCLGAFNEIKEQKAEMIEFARMQGKKLPKGIRGMFQ